MFIKLYPSIQFQKPFWNSTSFKHREAFRLASFMFSVLLIAPGFCRDAAAQVAIQASVASDANSPSTTVSSPLFSTAVKNELLLAFISTDATGGTNVTVTGVSGGGLTWALVKRTNQESGTSEIWRAFGPAVLSNVRVTATLSKSVVSSITVSTFSGVAASGTNGSGAIGAVASGYASSGAPHATLVTSQNGSLVVGVGNDYDNAISRIPVPGQSLLHQDLSSTGDTYWVQRVNATTATKGTTVVLGDSSPTTDRYNLSICEVLPAAAVSLTASASSLNFGSVTDGTTSQQSLTLKSTGTSPVTISSDSISGTGFSVGAVTLPATLSPGQSLTLTVSFAPKTVGSSSGQLTVSSNSSSGSTMTVSLSGSGVPATSGSVLSVSPGSLAFGNVADGSSQVLNVTLSSTGTSSLVINSASVSGTGFSLIAGSWPQTLASGQSLTVQVKFAPTVVASQTGALTISSNSSNGATSQVVLTGSGIGSPQIAINPTAVSFGTVDVGVAATKTVTLTSTGTTSLTVSSGSVTGSGFSLSGGTFPLSLNPGSTAMLTIKFAPTAGGTDSGTLSLNTNSSGGSTSTVPLSGTGQAAATVDLSWNAPVNSPATVTGYNVYRSLSGSGSFALLNSTPDQQTSYADATVTSGATYVYEVKSVASDGVESAASNQFTISIP